MKEITYKNHIAGQWAEAVAADYFRRLGFSVSNPTHTCTKGPDLKIQRHEKVYKVEVKYVGKSLRTRRVKRVLKKRQKDDFVAMVFPSGWVQVEAMQDHLKLCAKDGSRHIGRLAKLY